MGAITDFKSSAREQEAIIIHSPVITSYSQGSTKVGGIWEACIEYLLNANSIHIRDEKPSGEYKMSTLMTQTFKSCQVHFLLNVSLNNKLPLNRDSLQRVTLEYHGKDVIYAILIIHLIQGDEEPSLSHSTNVLAYFYHFLAFLLLLLLPMLIV